MPLIDISKVELDRVDWQEYTLRYKSKIIKWLGKRMKHKSGSFQKESKHLFDHRDVKYEGKYLTKPTSHIHKRLKNKYRGKGIEYTKLPGNKSMNVSAKQAYKHISEMGYLLGYWIRFYKNTDHVNIFGINRKIDFNSIGRDYRINHCKFTN